MLVKVNERAAMVYTRASYLAAICTVADVPSLPGEELIICHLDGDGFA